MPPRGSSRCRQRAAHERLHDAIYRHQRYSPLMSIFAQQHGIDAVAQAVNNQQVHFLNTRRTLRRHANLDVRIGQHFAHWPPPLPVSAITIISRSCASAIARYTWAALPDVRNGQAAHLPHARTRATACAKIGVKRVVAPVAVSIDESVGQRDRRQARALALETRRSSRQRNAARRPPSRRCRTRKSGCRSRPRRTSCRWQRQSGIEGCRAPRVSMPRFRENAVEFVRLTSTSLPCRRSPIRDRSGPFFSAQVYRHQPPRSPRFNCRPREMHRAAKPAAAHRTGQHRNDTRLPPAPRVIKKYCAASKIRRCLCGPMLAAAPPKRLLGPRAHFHENHRAVSVAHDEVDFAAPARDVARQQAHALPLQKIQRQCFEDSADPFRPALPGKVVVALGIAFSLLWRHSRRRRTRRARVAQ